MEVEINVRQAIERDLDQISTLFYETINTVNSKDYNPEQIKVWSFRDADFWRKRFAEQYFLVAEKGDQVVGFSSLTTSGYLDFMYVHKDYQRKGIAKKLLMEIEDYGRKFGLQNIHTHVSITAKPFFESKGYTIIRRQRKMHNDIAFVQYAMEKNIS
jgi:putative acetyltransferase